MWARPSHGLCLEVDPVVDWLQELAHVSDEVHRAVVLGRVPYGQVDGVLFLRWNKLNR